MKREEKIAAEEDDEEMHKIKQNRTDDDLKRIFFSFSRTTTKKSVICICLMSLRIKNENRICIKHGTYEYILILYTYVE